MEVLLYRKPRRTRNHTLVKTPFVYRRIRMDDDDTIIDHEDLDDESHSQPSTSSQTNERKELPNKLKYLTAAVIFYGNIAYGCAINTYGPVITSMQNKYGTDDATISKAFTIMTGCYPVGALVAGLIFNFVNRQLAVIAIASTMAGIMFVTPHCPTLTTFFISAGVMGFCSGSYDAAQFVWMMEMMQKDCPPYVQCQNFFYALGTNLASLTMAPFLDEEDDNDVTTTTSSFLIMEDHNLLNENITLDVVTRKSETDGSKLFIPYTILGGLVSLYAVAQTMLFIFMRYYPPPPETEITEQLLPKTEDEEEERQNVSRFKIGTWPIAKLRIVVLSAAFFGAYQGCEFTTFQFYPKFGQNSDLKLSESESAYVLTGMTATYAVGRAIAIIAVFKISTQLILCGNLVLLLVANVILFGWANSSLSMLWASSILFGFGLSSVYASFSAYVERYLNFTNFIGSLMLVCSSCVAAVYPLIVGHYIEKNPIVLCYTTFFSILVLVLTLGWLSFLTHRDKTRY